MTRFKVLFISNLKRRIMDGFSVGYNILSPLLMIWLLGLLCKNMYQDELLTSYQYYGVVTIPFCIIMSIITAAYAGKDDAFANTADRILLAPVSDAEIVCAKILAEMIVFAGCSLLVLLVVNVFSYIGSYKELGAIGLCYLSLSFVTACIGTFLGLGMKDFMKMKNILNIPVMIFAILGGCFYQFGTLNKPLQFVLNLSPLRWVNRSIFLLIYDKNCISFYRLNFVLIGIGGIFMLLAITCFKREEYGNGQLPGYEK